MYRPTILVIEADPAVRQLFREVLTSEGYMVEQMARLNLLNCPVAQIKPDLMLLEVTPPTLGQALQMIERLRRQEASAQLPIVVSTTDQQLAEKLAPTLDRLGCSSLLKPFYLDYLLETINQNLPIMLCPGSEVDGTVSYRRTHSSRSMA